MKIALIGASGKVGSKIRDELVRRGHAVTAISRNSPVKGNVNSPETLAKALHGHDAVVSSVTFFPGSSALLVDAVTRSGVKRYVAVGGAGSLEIAPGRMLKDSGNIPAEWMPAINEGTALLNLLRPNTDLEWTFFSPAALIGPGERTGKFRLGLDQLITDADGKSAISYDDYAIALVDELETPRHVRRRFTIGY